MSCHLARPIPVSPNTSKSSAVMEHRPIRERQPKERFTRQSRRVLFQSTDVAQREKCVAPLIPKHSRSDKTLSVTTKHGAVQAPPLEQRIPHPRLNPSVSKDSISESLKSNDVWYSDDDDEQGIVHPDRGEIEHSKCPIKPSQGPKTSTLTAGIRCCRRILTDPSRKQAERMIADKHTLDDGKATMAKLVAQAKKCGQSPYHQYGLRSQTSTRADTQVEIALQELTVQCRVRELGDSQWRSL